jgi:hypothetical protein
LADSGAGKSTGKKSLPFLDASMLIILLAIGVIIAIICWIFSGIGEKKVSLDNIPDGTVVISEYMSKNTATIYDSAGRYSDWIELYNPGKVDVNIEGYTLTDNPNDPKQYTFPQGTVIRAGDVLLIWCEDAPETDAAVSDVENAPLYTGFALSERDTVVLSYGVLESDADSRGSTEEESKSSKARTTTAAAPAMAYNEVKIETLPDNVSRGRSPTDLTAWYYYSSPTPGAVNGTGFETLRAAKAPEGHSLLITEVGIISPPDLDMRRAERFVELFNPGSENVSFEGCGLFSSSGKALYEFTEAGTLDAGKYMYVSVPDLDLNGNTIILRDRSGVYLDHIITGRLEPGVSYGRKKGSMTCAYYAAPTRGEENKGSTFTGYAPAPVFTPDGGYSSTRYVECKAPGAEVRYTTDGTEPTEKSPRFKGKIEITKDTAFRAKAFSSKLLPSTEVCATFLLQRHDLPVVAVVSDKDGLYKDNTYANDTVKGILADGANPGAYPHLGANYWQDWERAASVQYISPEGKPEVAFSCGIQVFGQYTRTYAQKSLALHLRGIYGPKEVTYKFFPGNQYSTFSDFVLRAGGQDQAKTRLRDAFCAEVFEGYSANVVKMDWQPVVLYINGEYNGLYALREKINDSLLASRYGLDTQRMETIEYVTGEAMDDAIAAQGKEAAAASLTPGILKDHVEIIKGDGNVRTDGAQATDAGWRELRNFLKNHDMSDPGNYAKACEMMDMASFIDALIAEIFFADEDSGNIKAFRQTPITIQDAAANQTRVLTGTPWRWVLFDFDRALQGSAINSIEEMFNPDGHGNEDQFTTIMQRSLWKSEKFRNQFLTRYRNLLKTAFAPERLTGLLDEMAVQIRSEIASNHAKWGNLSEAQWENAVAQLREIVANRTAIASRELEAFAKTH